MKLTSITLKVNGADIQASVTGTLTSGMVGIPVTIQYDDSWAGLTKNLVCRCCRGADSTEHRTILNVGSTAVVAHEVMKAGMLLYLGVEGRNADGTLVIPTIWAMCGVIQTGANTSEDLSTDPTLPVWGQLQTEIERIRQDAVTPEQLTGILSDIQSAVQASAIYADRAEAAAQRAEEAAGPSQNGGLTSEQINALDGMFRVCAFVQEDVSAQYNAFRTAFGLDGSGGEIPDEPEQPEKTLTGISAVYSGGPVPVGTAVSALTGVVVTAHYSDGSTAAITGYTLSGTIADGSNTITVNYQSKTAAFTVTGVPESGGSESSAVNLFDKNTMVTEDYFIGGNGQPSKSSGSKYATVPVSANTTYALQKSDTYIAGQWGSGSSGCPGWYDSEMNLLSTSNTSSPNLLKDPSGKGIKLTSPENAAFVCLSLKVNASGTDYTDTFMIEVGDTCHDYVAYAS